MKSQRSGGGGSFKRSGRPAQEIGDQAQAGRWLFSGWNWVPAFTAGKCRQG
jgi:hypothetical protein